MTNDPISPIDGDYVPLATLVRVLADEVEQLSSTDDLDQHHPAEGRVAEIAAGDRPYDTYIGTGDAWIETATLGLATTAQRIDTQDLTADGSPAPASNGVQAAHDGTGTPPAGTYTSDPANDQWVGADDLTSGTTIAY